MEMQRAFPRDIVGVPGDIKRPFLRDTAQIDLPAIGHHAARSRALLVFSLTQANAGAKRQRAAAVAERKQYAVADMGLIVCLHHRPAAGDQA